MGWLVGDIVVGWLVIVLAFGVWVFCGSSLECFPVVLILLVVVG